MTQAMQSNLEGVSFLLLWLLFLSLTSLSFFCGCLQKFRLSAPFFHATMAGRNLWASNGKALFTSAKCTGCLACLTGLLAILGGTGDKDCLFLTKYLCFSSARLRRCLFLATRTMLGSKHTDAPCLWGQRICVLRCLLWDLRFNFTVLSC